MQGDLSLLTRFWQTSLWSFDDLNRAVLSTEINLYAFIYFIATVIWWVYCVLIHLTAITKVGNAHFHFLAENLTRRLTLYCHMPSQHEATTSYRSLETQWDRDRVVS